MKRTSSRLVLLSVFLLLGFVVLGFIIPWLTCEHGYSVPRTYPYALSVFYSAVINYSVENRGAFPTGNAQEAIHELQEHGFLKHQDAILLSGFDDDPDYDIYYCGGGTLDSSPEMRIAWSPPLSDDEGDRFRYVLTLDGRIEREDVPNDSSAD